MARAVELLRQGRSEELWQMCCGFTSLTLEQFMTIQRRLLLEQLELLRRSPLGIKVMRGSKPRTVEEFRRQVPLTRYADYLPELDEKQEDMLPAKPATWVRTSGRSGEYPCRWIPLTPAFSREMSAIMYGIGMLSSCEGWGSTDGLPEQPRMVYTVAPRPYMSGAMASLLEQQTPVRHMPVLEEAEELSFEERVKLGFKQALTQGIDYFFGMSLVLAAVGDKISNPSEKMAIRPLLAQPRALLRLGKGLLKSKLARRAMLPRDLWSVKGIISSGLDSWVYRDKIKALWGRYPLDVYAATEGGIIATQLWDYDSMTFIPNLNFLEFIPESENLKWDMDHSYQPKTVLLDEVIPGESYEIVVTNFHGGALARYRIGDMIKITARDNAALGIHLPQMVFERRTDGILDFVVVKLTEKIIWQAVEKAGVAYQDWTAYKKPGDSVLHLLIEPRNGYQGSAADIAAAVYEQVMDSGRSSYRTSGVKEDWRDALDFSVDVNLLPQGAFASYTAQRQAEGADLAHLKPPHLNPPEKVLSLLLAGAEKAAAEAAAEPDKVAVH